MNLWFLFLIFVLLVTTDKIITAANIIQVNKNFPKTTEKDPYQIEKNPAAKYFFDNYGLWGGTFLYWILSIATLFFAYYILTFAFDGRVALYVIMLLYALVIMNNFYFLLKYSKVFI